MHIASTDFWFKLVGMLQQNWALIDTEPAGGVTVWFIDDGSGVFDQMRFPTAKLAAAALRNNDFQRLAANPGAREFISPPGPPYSRTLHPNGPIYSSGQFWTSPPPPPPAPPSLSPPEHP